MAVCVAGQAASSGLAGMAARLHHPENTIIQESPRSSSYPETLPWAPFNEAFTSFRSHAVILQRNVFFGMKQKPQKVRKFIFTL